MNHRLPSELRDLDGDALLGGLVSAGRWDMLEAMWRSGSADIAARAGAAMAASGDAEVVDLVACAFGAQVAGQPADAELQSLLDDAMCSPDMADSLLGQVSNDERTLASPHVLWLLRQEGGAVGSFALGAVENPELPIELRYAAAQRCAQDPSVQRKAVEAIAALGRRSPGEWSEAAELLVRAIGHDRVNGATDLLRAMVGDVLSLPATSIPEAFVSRVAAKPNLVTDLLIDLEALPADSTSGAYRLISSLMWALDALAPSVELAFCLAEHHPAIWAGFHTDLTSQWSEATWEAFFVRVPTVDADEVDLLIGPALADCVFRPDLAVVVTASIHVSTADPASHAVGQAAGRLRAQLVGTDDDLDVIGGLAVPDPTVETWQPFLEVLRQAISDQTRRAKVVGSLVDRGTLPPGPAIDLIEPGSVADALEALQDDTRAGEMTRAALDRDPQAAAEIAAVLDDSFDAVIVTELARAGFMNEAFRTVDACWNALDSDDKDLVVDLLENHATINELGVLDFIVAQTAGSNRGRRARAARRWAALVDPGSAFTPGIAGLLQNAATPDLAEAVAEVAKAVRPTDPDTLRALRDRWAGDAKNPVSSRYREALDAIDSDLAARLAASPDHELPETAPPLCEALAITAGPDGFVELVALVGRDARNDVVDLRRTAAAAIREYFTAHPVTATPEMLASLSAVAGTATGDLDSEARRDLAAALRAAELGEDAVLAVLDDALGADHRLGELLAGEKAETLRALNQIVVRRSEGPSGESSLVQELDNAAHHIARATYLAAGKKENLKQKIAADPGATQPDPKFGNILEALSSSGVAVNNLQTLHYLRSTKTTAHGGTLEEGDVDRAETEFAEGIAALYRVLDGAEGPSLRAVPDP